MLSPDPAALFYHSLKFFARLALRLYCRDIYTHQARLLRQEGPLLLAANHPNSFLDAAIIASHCRRKTFVLVRGDVFSNKWAGWILRKIYCLPIYRRSEGRDLMGQNENTFSESLERLREGYNILIFAEGICENEWKLRDLGKGTARLACRAWQDRKIAGTFRVLPVGITYNDFDHIGKKTLLIVGTPLSSPPDATVPRALTEFNDRLRGSLTELMIRVPAQPDAVGLFRELIERMDGETPVLQELRLMQQCIDGNIPAGGKAGLRHTKRITKKWLLAPFALAGWIIHAPLYYPMRALARRFTKGTVFYDSVLFGLLFFGYPVYAAILICLAIGATGNWWWLTLVAILPFLGRIAIRYRRKRSY